MTYLVCFTAGAVVGVALHTVALVGVVNHVFTEAREAHRLSREAVRQRDAAVRERDAVLRLRPQPWGQA